MRDIVPFLAAELDAEPHFRSYTYRDLDDDPICGWLYTFHLSKNETEEDLRRLAPRMRREDVLYVNSAQPPQFMALINWVRSAGNRYPNVVIEFGTDPGIEMDARGDLKILSVQDMRNVLWRFAARHMPSDGIPRFHMVTFDPNVSRLYARLLEQQVDVLPLPQVAQSQPINRVGKRPVTIAVLGHQRSNKGYQLVPTVIRILLEKEPNSRFLIHNAEPERWRATQQELRAFSSNNPRLVLDERVAGREIWHELLSRADLILCPYDPVCFAARYSAVAAEAIANGIPLVVPASTTLSRLLFDHGEPGTTFAVQTPSVIADAVQQALAQFDLLADRAYRSALQWGNSMGAANMVGKMLELVNPSVPKKS